MSNPPCHNSCGMMKMNIINSGTGRPKAVPQPSTINSQLMHWHASCTLNASMRSQAWEQSNSCLIHVHVHLHSSAHDSTIQSLPRTYKFTPYFPAVYLQFTYKLLQKFAAPRRVSRNFAKFRDTFFCNSQPSTATCNQTFNPAKTMNH